MPEIVDPFVEGYMQRVDAILERYKTDLSSGLDQIFQEADTALCGLLEVTQDTAAPTVPDAPANEMSSAEYDAWITQHNESMEYMLRYTWSWSGKGDLSDAQQLDVRELYAGVPLTRHAWLQELRDQKQDTGEDYSRQDVARAMLARLDELTSRDERDFELERATLELGARSNCIVDPYGGQYVALSVSSSEAYHRTTSHNPDSFDWKYGERNAVGAKTVQRQQGKFVLGSEIDFEGNDATRWFYACGGGEEGRFEVPLDSITEVLVAA